MSAPEQVVERFLSIALGQEFDRLPEVMDDALVIVEPRSLPYGGEYSGPGAAADRSRSGSCPAGGAVTRSGDAPR